MPAELPLVGNLLDTSRDRLEEATLRLATAFRAACEATAGRVQSLADLAETECTESLSKADNSTMPDALERAALLKALLADIDEAETRVLHLEQLAAIARNQRLRVTELERRLPN